MLGRRTLSVSRLVAQRTRQSNSLLKRCLSSDADLKLSSDEHGIATLYLNKPPVNSLGLEFMNQIISKLDQVEKDSRGLVLTSSNKSIFCAGLDLKEMYQPEEQRYK